MLISQELLSNDAYIKMQSSSQKAGAEEKNTRFLEHSEKWLAC